MKTLQATFILFIVLLSSCGSKKKLNQAEIQKADLEEEIAKLRSDKEECNENFTMLEDEILSYKKAIAELQGRAENKIELTASGQLITEETKSNIRNIFSNLSEEEASKAQTLEDSINLAIAYNIKSDLMNQMDDSESFDDDAIEIKVSEPIVSITLTDKILFKSGSYWVDKKAYKLLAKISDVINSEQNMDIRVEGHADKQKIAESSYIVDNWDLSIRRATSVVRTLENKFSVEGERLIASGRSHFYPVADNSTVEGRAQNRRTTILLQPRVERYLELINKPNQGMVNNLNNFEKETQTNVIKTNKKQEKVFGRQEVNSSINDNQSNDEKAIENQSENESMNVSVNEAKPTEERESQENLSERRQKQLSLREKRAAERTKREKAAENRKKENQRKKDSIRNAIKNRGKNRN